MPDELIKEIEPLMRRLLGGFIYHPDDLDIQPVETDTFSILCIKVNRDDHPRVVGGSGRNIVAITKIFEMIGTTQKKRVRVKLNEPEVGVRKPNRPFEANLEYDSSDLEELLEDLLDLMLHGNYDLDVQNIEGTEVTTVEITPEVFEANRFTEEIKNSLKFIFESIGKAHGRNLELAVIDERQA